MTDFSNLSDEQLKALHQQSSVGGMSDEELKAAYAGMQKPNYSALKSFGPLGTAASALETASPGMISDVPREVYEAGKSALSGISKLNPFSDEAHAKTLERLKGNGLAGTLQQYGDVGSGLASVPELAAAPITGAARSLIGHPYSTATGIPYEQSKEAVDTAMMGLAPGRGGFRKPVPIPPRPQTGPLGVTLSEGQATGDLPAIRREQAAKRGQMGKSAEEHATEFFDTQQGEVAQAKENIAKGLDPYNMQIAESPQEAGALISEGMQKEAGIRKAGIRAAYKDARDRPGEIHAGAFEGIGQKIKGDLTLRDNPVIIDDRTTPIANAALGDIEKTIDRLKIPNRADPFGPPNPENITGVNLKGVEQIRKRLSSFRQSAWSSGNASDGRAASAIIDAFDNHIDDAIKGGLFTGDPLAVKAWNAARAAHADYKKTFAAGKNDPIGRVVEKIIGKGVNEAATGNDVADFFMGASGTNPSSLNVGVAKRIKNTLGENSLEWTAAKQGLFSRLTEPGAGQIDWGPQKIAQRINKFLNADGKELSEAVFSSSERALLQRYADLQRHLIVPPTGANRSETSTFMAPMLKKIGSAIGVAIGAVVGHLTLPGLPWGVGEAVGAGVAKVAGKVGESLQARKIAKQMPLINQTLKKWQEAVSAAQLANKPLTTGTVQFATANLAKSLASIGIDFKKLGQLQGTLNAPASENQPQ